MLQLNQSINFNGSSTIDEDGTNKSVMTMSADYNNGRVYLHKNIENIDLYDNNKDTVDADYNQFETAVYNMIDSLKALESK